MMQTKDKNKNIQQYKMEKNNITFDCNDLWSQRNVYKKLALKLKLTQKRHSKQTINYQKKQNSIHNQHNIPNYQIISVQSKSPMRKLSKQKQRNFITHTQNFFASIGKSNKSQDYVRKQPTNLDNFICVSKISLQQIKMQSKQIQLENNKKEKQKMETKKCFKSTHRKTNSINQQTQTRSKYQDKVKDFLKVQPKALHISRIEIEQKQFDDILIKGPKTHSNMHFHKHNVKDSFRFKRSKTNEDERRIKSSNDNKKSCRSIISGLNSGWKIPAQSIFELDFHCPI